MGAPRMYAWHDGLAPMLGELEDEVMKVVWPQVSPKPAGSWRLLKR